MGMPGGMELLVIFIPFVIWILFLFSLNKLVNAVKLENEELTKVSKVWVWLQIIPIIGFIVLIVFNLKMDTAIRAYERKYNLDLKSIAYPVVLCWLVILGVLYTWIPVIGLLLLILFMIMYWVKVSSTTRQLISIKSQN